MQFLRPHEDELVGSALSRAIRYSGLSVPHLLRAVTGRRVVNHSFIVARHPMVAWSFGMPADMFARRHTMTEYSLAFMPVERRAAIWNSALSSAPNSGWMGNIAKDLTNTHPKLRYCAACVKDDVSRFGDSYWRRAHQLPAVSVCLVHQQPLVVSSVPLQPRLPVEPPHRCIGEIMCSNLSVRIQMAIARWSVDCLNGGLQAGRTWPEWFRDKASATGYQLSQGTNFGTRLSRDLERYFTHSFLAEHKCAVDRQVGLQWPARLLRDCSHGIEPLKNVLMCVFLDSNPEPTPPKVKEFKARGPRRDRSAQDIEAVERMARAAAQLRSKGHQFNLTMVLRQAGLEDVWRHSYLQLPRLQAWVAQFKTTQQYRRWVKVPAA